VAIVHESRDRAWWFVVGNLYAAWVEKRFVAEGDKSMVFGYVDKAPYLVVTGAEVRTTTTPEQPALSDLQLDMGVRVPWLRDFPGERGVNGQAAYASYVIELPVRDADGRLRIAPALLPRTADVSPDYLPLTTGNLLRQSFKFLGERYGWGHDYDARDCSGFVSEVYRSMGVTLPRNTRDQSVSPALNRIALTEADDAARRARIAGELQVGDLVYIPGHVMMVIGHDQGMPYVIHDTNGGSWLGADGRLVAGHLNGVSVTPLTPLRFDQEHSYIDRMTNIQRIRP
jgi:cell wall-associated NlpC family hydrolase